MSTPKSSRGGGAASKSKKPVKVAEDKREDVLQAVVLADSFQDRFAPLTLTKPRCLLPLANTPLIEYTLEYLALNGVQEVFIYCGAHAEQIEDFVRKSPRWSPTSSVLPFQSLEFVRVANARSVGDFLRDLDPRGIIAGDFVLVHGDLVANVPLDEALRKHRARREANREAIMTMVLREGGQDAHRTKPAAVKPVFAIDTADGRCLHYEEMHPLQGEHYANLDPEVLEHAEVEVRADLIDCGIDICTPDVLALWTEGFDYEEPRKHFLHGTLKDWELNGKLIYAEVVDEGYAARASNLQMYAAISDDILGRWTDPFLPDNNLASGNSYALGSDRVCAEEGVKFAPESKGRDAVIGAYSSVARRSTVLNSTIGRRCKIGKRVRLENSSIWDDVTIADGAVVRGSILACNVTIGKNVTLQDAVVAEKVQIGDDVRLPKGAVLSLLAEDGSAVKDDTKLLGAQGKGAAYVTEEEDVDETDPALLEKSLIYSQPNVSASSISSLASEESSEEEDAGDDLSALTSELNTSRSRLSSFASDDSTGLKATSFHTDAVHGLLDALRDEESSADFDSAKLEFMGLRLAHDANDHSVRRAVAVAFARRAAELVAPQSGQPGVEPTKAAEETLRTRKGAAKFVKEVGVGDAPGAQAEFALALQKALASVKALSNAKAGNLLSAMLQQLYDLDVLEEDGVLAWWADKRASEGETMSAVREKVRVLVEWLEEEDDDDEDSD
jgi:translation initiation factor eIF-2B subunit epsilon